MEWNEEMSYQFLKGYVMGYENKEGKDFFSLSVRKMLEYYAENEGKDEKGDSYSL